MTQMRSVSNIGKAALKDVDYLGDAMTKGIDGLDRPMNYLNRKLKNISDDYRSGYWLGSLAAGAATANLAYFYYHPHALNLVVGITDALIAIGALSIASVSDIKNVVRSRRHKNNGYSIL